MGLLAQQGSTGGRVPRWLSYSNQNATRNGPLSQELVGLLGPIANDLGLRVDVYSGGQPETGPNRVGSTRHNNGNAADLRLLRDGNAINFETPEGRAIGADFVQRAAAAGATGIGYAPDYMGPEAMHVGFGAPAVWGANGRSANAPGWLREAYNAGRGSAGAAQSTRGNTMGERVHGGLLGLANGAEQSPRQGLLGRMSSGDAPEGLLGAVRSEGGLGGHFRDMIRSGEFFDRFALVANSLRMNPDPNIAAQARADIRRREDGRERNRTLQYLGQMAQENPALGEIYQAAANGVISPSQAFNTMMQARQGQAPVRGVNIGGRLVNPVTGAVMADFSEDDEPSPYTQAGKLSADLRSGLISEEQYRQGLANLDDTPAPSSAEATIGRLREVNNPQTGQPFTREEAIRVNDLYTVSRDPQTGEAQLINRATGQRVNAPTQSQGGSAGVPSAALPTVRQPEDYGNVAGALGVGGMAANAVNTIGDTVGLGLAFPDAERAESALRNLSTQTMLVMSGEWSGRPSNLTRERIEALTVRPNEFGTGQGSALIKLRDVRDMIDNALRSAMSVQDGQFTPTQKTQARQKANDLTQLLNQYNALIANLQGGGAAQGSTGGQTAGGINWSVEQ